MPGNSCTAIEDEESPLVRLRQSADDRAENLNFLTLQQYTHELAELQNELVDDIRWPQRFGPFYFLQHEGGILSQRELLEALYRLPEMTVYVPKVVWTQNTVVWTQNTEYSFATWKIDTCTVCAIFGHTNQTATVGVLNKEKGIFESIDSSWLIVDDQNVPTGNESDDFKANDQEYATATDDGQAKSTSVILMNQVSMQMQAAAREIGAGEENGNFLWFSVDLGEFMIDKEVEGQKQKGEPNARESWKTIWRSCAAQVQEKCVQLQRLTEKQAKELKVVAVKKKQLLIGGPGVYILLSLRGFAIISNASPEETIQELPMIERIQKNDNSLKSATIVLPPMSYAEQVQQLATALLTNTVLESLELKKNELEGLLAPLADALRENQTLTDLAMPVQSEQDSFE